jgi:transposase
MTGPKISPKIDDYMRRRVKALYDEGIPTVTIAKTFGVGAKTIRHIIRAMNGGQPLDPRRTRTWN